MHETTGGGRHRRLLLAGLAHVVGQRRIDCDVAIRRKRHKALREIDIARGKRRANFAFRHVAIEGARQRTIADRDRIVGRGLLIVRGQAAANEETGRYGAKNAHAKRRHRVARYSKKSFAERKFTVCVLHCGLGPDLS